MLIWSLCSYSQTNPGNLSTLSHRNCRCFHESPAQNLNIIFGEANPARHISPVSVAQPGMPLWYPQVSHTYLTPVRRNLLTPCQGGRLGHLSCPSADHAAWWRCLEPNLDLSWGINNSKPPSFGLDFMHFTCCHHCTISWLHIFDDFPIVRKLPSCNFCHERQRVAFILDKACNTLMFYFTAVI